MKLFSRFLLIFFPFMCQAQVLYDDNAIVTNGNNISFINLNSFIVPEGADRILVVSIGYRQESVGGITSVNYNGQPLSEGISVFQDFGGVVPFSSLWYLPLGTGVLINSDISIQFATNTNYTMITAATYQNVDQTNPKGNIGTSIGIGTQSTISLNVNPQDLVVDNILSGGPNPIVVGANQEEISIILNNSVNGSSYELALGNSVSMSWSKPNTSYTHVAMELNQCISCSPLPVTLISFSGIAKNNKIFLQWETANELNNAGFEIERSRNSKDWQTIQFIKGHGCPFEINNYESIDVNPYYSANYYRLKQIDLDGTFKYSNVLCIFLDQINSVKIYPNPTDGWVKIESEELSEVEIRDSFGREISRKKLINGNVNISNLPSGLYFFYIKTFNGIVLKRIYKY